MPASTTECKRWKIISGIEDMIVEINSLVKENVKSKKIPNTKHPGDVGHHENTKPKNNRDRRMRRIPAQGHRRYIQENYRRKLSQPKEGHTYKCSRSLRNTKETAPKRKSHCHKIIKTLNIWNKRILRAMKENAK